LPTLRQAFLFGAGLQTPTGPDSLSITDHHFASMQILVINCGSSSIKFAVLALSDTGELPVLSGLVERIGESGSRLTLTGSGSTGKTSSLVEARDHRQGFDLVFQALSDVDAASQIDAIGHRVVHGGTAFRSATSIDRDVIAAIRDLIPLAPLHNPVNLLGIEICRARFPDTPQIAVFDTAFHQTLPPHAYRYAVPESWFTQLGIRRYGFHGTAHQYLAEQSGRFLGRPVNLVTLHLGNGASACAIRQGQCIDTSMGFTPLEGLIMGSRCGDLDAAAALAAARKLGLDAAESDLQNRSGLKGLAGTNDVREILQRADGGDEACDLALQAYCYRIRKYLGSYYAALGTVDAVVFSGGVGENSAQVRQRVCGELEGLGIDLDPHRNDNMTSQAIQTISRDHSPVKILVIQANEELAIARQTQRALAGRNGESP
jgi:acetate kinase